MFDGTLARATGEVSQLGAFMDSVFDRCGRSRSSTSASCSGPPSTGITRVPILAAAAMGAAFMVSYVRAKSEGLGFTPGTGMAAVGIMPREVRLVILVDRACILAECARTSRPSNSPSASSPSARPSPSSSGSSTSAAKSTPRQTTGRSSRTGADVSTNGKNGNGNGTTARHRQHLGRRRPSRRRQGPRRDRRRRQLREQPRPGPLLLRERERRRLRPGPDARQPRRLPRPRHRVRRRVRHRQEQGRQGPRRGDLHQAEQHVRLPAGRASSASRSSAG